MIINNRDIDFKVTRPKDAERFEKALKSMQRKEQAINGKYQKGDLPLSKALEELIRLLSEFFISVTGVDVLEGVDDYEEAQTAYIDFLSTVMRQKEIFTTPYSRLQIDAEVDEE